MNKKRVVIVGTGNSVGNHLEAIQALSERVELIAAVDSNAERVQQFCTQYNVPNHYTDVTAMLAHEQPDLVCVVTPPASHKHITIECLEANAWVYCEKPLCASLADFDDLTAAENRTGNYVSTVFQWRFGSAVKHIRQLMAESALGKPLVAVCNTLWYRTADYYDAVWRGRYETEFGGPTMTLGIHLMDLLLYLMGDWQDVRAAIGTLEHNIEVEDTAMAIVRFQNGAMGSIINTALAPRQESYLRFDFQKTTLEMTGLYRASNANWTLTPTDRDALGVKAVWDTLDIDFQGSHVQQLSEILDALDANTRPPVSGDEARRIIEFTASLYKSAHTGQVVTRGDITPDDPFYYANDGSRKAIPTS
ncbi:MAG: Gfo/Idh/MocA family protein [Anaerolineae bacterium]